MYSSVDTYYFLGIGGIGMSALARYFAAKGFRVLGYDRTSSPLTKELEAEGIRVQYDDDLTILNTLEVGKTLVVRTPAVPEDTPLYSKMRAHGYHIVKRAEVLGNVTRFERALCVAGTHGKTTTSTMLAHILYQSQLGCSAFMGGISNNYGTNLLINKASDLVVVEADEYDRSFHHLTPYMSVITSMDPDHLDIYGSENTYCESFMHYASLVKEALVVKRGLTLDTDAIGARVYTYAQDEDADFSARNVRYDNGTIVFDFHALDKVFDDMRMSVPVWVNVENSVAALSIAYLLGLTEQELRNGLESFSGVYRRFNVHVNTSNLSYIDDYAHHPEELRASIESVRRLFPYKRLLVVFQPHLFSRTRDFAQGFADVLSTADGLLLLPIYPARELPIAGVSSQCLLDLMSVQPSIARLVEKAEVIENIQSIVHEWKGDGFNTVVMTLGAGDIDRLVQDIKQNLNIYE